MNHHCPLIIPKTKALFPAGFGGIAGLGPSDSPWPKMGPKAAQAAQEAAIATGLEKEKAQRRRFEKTTFNSGGS